jgi:subtilase family serine protease
LRFALTRHRLFVTTIFTALLFLQPASAQRVQMTSQAAASQRVEFDIFLPLHHADDLDQLLEAQHTPGSAQYHQWLTPQEFQQSFGPTEDDIARISATLGYYGLNVTAVHGQGVHVAGNAGSVNRAFGTTLMMGKTPHGSKVISAQPLTLPNTLQQMGAQVVHFSPEIRMHPHTRIVREVNANTTQPDNRYGANGPYWFNDIKQAYDFPSYQALSGKGRTIAIVIDSDYSPADLSAYFAHESTNAAPIAAPKVVRDPVLGGTAFDPNSGDSLECMLDLEQAGGMAPGATLELVNIPDLSDEAVVAGYLHVVEENVADIVSSSFGGPEGQYTAAYQNGQDFTGILRSEDSLFKQGNAQGITFVASSGDAGGLGLPPLSYFTAPPQKPAFVVGSFQAGVDFPASSPNVTAVGGGNLVTTFDPPSFASNYVSESAFAQPEKPSDPFGLGNLVSGGYFGAGGGKSVVFGKPGYQRLIPTHSSTRAVPDIAMLVGGKGQTDSSALEAFGGQLYGVIGTSVAAPEFAGVLALKEELLGGSRLGNVNYEIYSQAAQQPNVGGSPLDFFHGGQPGFDGLYSTLPGYDFIYGVGSPSVRNFIHASQLPAAGDPRTPSNP